MKSKSLSIIICAFCVFSVSMFAQENAKGEQPNPEQRLISLIINYVDWENSVYNSLYNQQTPKDKRDEEDEQWCEIIKELETYMWKKYFNKLSTPDLTMARLIVMEDWSFSGSYHKIYFVYPKKGTLQMVKSGLPIDWSKHSVNIMAHRMSPTKHEWGRLACSGGQEIKDNRDKYIKAFKKDIDYHFTEPEQFDYKIKKYEKIEKPSENQ